MKRSLGTGAYLLKVIAIMGFLALFLTGCGTKKTTMINSEPPLPVPPEILDDLREIAISDVISAVPMDKVIGHGHQGLINIQNDTYVAGSKISEAHLLIITALEEELSAAGYKFLQTKSSLFGAAKGGESPDQMLIGGEIIECKFNSYNKIGQINSKAEAAVTWSLFDPISETVVLEVETFGEAVGPEKSVSSLAYAVRASFREFLNDARFVDTLMKE